MIVGPPPLAPQVTWADGRPVGRLEPLTLDLPHLPPVLWPGDGRLPDATLVGVQIELPALPGLAQSASLALGQRAPQVAVRYASPANVATVATVCAAPLPRDDASATGADACGSATTPTSPAAGTPPSGPDPGGFAGPPGER